jgi:hypothetical protein
MLSTAVDTSRQAVEKWQEIRRVFAAGPTLVTPGMTRTYDDVI